MAEVVLEGVTRVYSGDITVVRDVDVRIADKEFVVLVGPSACGKSTTLRKVAGLEEITSGTIRIGERVVNDIPPKDRDIAMVFQNCALYPHMVVCLGAGGQAVLAKMRAKHLAVGAEPEIGVDKDGAHIFEAATAATNEGAEGVEDDEGAGNAGAGADPGTERNLTKNVSRGDGVDERASAGEGN